MKTLSPTKVIDWVGGLGGNVNPSGPQRTSRVVVCAEHRHNPKPLNPETPKPLKPETAKPPNSSEALSSWRPASGPKRARRAAGDGHRNQRSDSLAERGGSEL